MKRKLTKEFIQEFCKFIENGYTNKDACMMCDISENILYRWINRGEDNINNQKKSIEVEFVQSLKKAQATFKGFHITNITKASRTDWKASAWILERKFPEEYARTDKQSVMLNDDNGMLPQIMEMFKKIENKDDD